MKTGTEESSHIIGLNVGEDWAHVPNKYDWHPTVVVTTDNIASQEQGSQGQRLSLLFDQFFLFSGQFPN